MFKNIDSSGINVIEVVHVIVDTVTHLFGCMDCRWVELGVLWYDIDRCNDDCTLVHYNPLHIVHRLYDTMLYTHLLVLIDDT